MAKKITAVTKTTDEKPKDVSTSAAKPLTHTNVSDALMQSGGARVGNGVADIQQPMPTLNTPSESTYTPLQFDQAYYTKGIDTSFYDNAIKSYTDAANKERQEEIALADESRKQQLKQAYIQSLQNRRNVNDAMAAAGIRGGATETANLNIANQYGTARASANTDYSNAVRDINRSTDRNIMDYRSDMESRAEQYRQELGWNMFNAAREDYLTQVQMQREDAMNQAQMDREQKWHEEEVARQERQDKMAADQAAEAKWMNHYDSMYSSYSETQCKKAFNTAQNNYLKAVKNGDHDGIIRWRNAMDAARRRMGVLEQRGADINATEETARINNKYK